MATQAYQDGETRNVGGVTYVRQGGQWVAQGGPAAPAPAVRMGRPNLPTPQTGPQRRIDEGNAAAAPYAGARAAAEARKAAVEAAAAEEARQRHGLTAEQYNSLQSQYNSLGLLERGINRVDDLYQHHFRGRRSTASGYAPNAFNPINNTFESAADRLMSAIASAQGLTAQQQNTPAELRIRFGPLVPRATDDDATIEDKISALRDLLGSQRRTLSQQLGIEGPPLHEDVSRLVGAMGTTINAAPVPTPDNPVAPPPSDPNRVQPGESMGQVGNLPPLTDSERVAMASGRNELDSAGGPVLTDEDKLRAEHLASQATALARRGLSPDEIDAWLRGQGLQGLSAEARQTIESFRSRGRPQQFPGFAPNYIPTGHSGASFLTNQGNALVGGFLDSASLGLPALFSEDYRRRRDDLRASDPGASVVGSLAGSIVAPGGPRAGMSLGEQSLRSAGQGAVYGFNSSGGDVESALVGGGIGGAMPSAFRVAGGGARSVRSAFAAPARNALLAAAERQDIPLMRSDAGGTATQMATGVVGRTPGEIALVAGARRSVDATAAARDRVAGNIGRVTDQAGMGQAAQRGARKFLEQSGAREAQLFNRVPIAPDQPAQTSASRAALAERTAGMESNPMLGAMFTDQNLRGYLAALEGGGLSWRDMRRFRSLVGEKIEQGGVGADSTPVAAYRHLYAALTQDLEATAGAVGPRALTLARRATQYSRGRHARREGILTDILGPNFEMGAQDAAAQINRWAQRQGGNFASVGQVLRSMPASEANTVRASLFARLGRAKEGRQDASGELFSPAQFATDFAKLEPRALSFLANSPEHRQALNDLVRITNAQKASTRYANFSGTTLGTNALATGAGLMSNPVLTLSAVLGTYGAGRWLASPAGAGWLARASRMPASRMIRTLSTVAKRDPSLLQETLGLRHALLNAVNDNVPLQAVASDREGQNNQ